MRDERQSLIGTLATHVAEGVAAADLAAAATAVGASGNGRGNGGGAGGADERSNRWRPRTSGTDDEARLAAVASKAMIERELVTDGPAVAVVVPGLMTQSGRSL